MFFINLALSLHILTRRAPSETPRARLISAWLMPRSYIISKSSRSFSPRGRVSSHAGQSSPDSLRRDSAISSNISSRLRLEAFRRASFIFLSATAKSQPLRLQSSSSPSRCRSSRNTSCAASAASHSSPRRDRQKRNISS